MHTPRWVLRCVAAVVLAASAGALSGCARDTTYDPDVAATEEEELRGDTTYVRAVADAAGASLDVAGTAYASSLRAVDGAKLSAAWQKRVETEMDEYRTSDPERGFQSPVWLETHEVLRDGRVVGLVVNMGLVESWSPPSADALDDEGDAEPSDGVFLWFAANRRLLVAKSW